ncbi:MAG TPA: ESX secretion-associated protein EspG [Pseudonocardiaceae bacterium]|nr:ESX secretion-associated protein EspG [Pseudonocardiaceae bacterium]
MTVSLDTLAAVWRRENLGELHNVLVDTAYWMNDDEQRQSFQRAVDELNERGLVNQGSLDANFLDALRLVGRPSVEYYGWIAAKNGAGKNSAGQNHSAGDGDSPDEDRDIAVLVAGRGQDEGVLLIRDHHEVHLQSVGAEGLMGALIGQLPQVQAGRGRGVNLPEQEVRQLAAKFPAAPLGEIKPPPASEFDVFGRATMAEDARDWFAVMALPRTGGGQLYVAARNQYGERKRCAHPLTYVDTQQGRWIMQTTGDKPGDRWITSAPANRQMLLARLEEMRSRLPG